MVPDLSVENSFELITSELGKLQKTIQVISKIDEKNMPDIIGLYYQTIMVQTLAKKLKNDFGLSAKSKSLGVTLFTLSSVHWADNKTATKRVKWSL